VCAFGAAVLGKEEPAALKVTLDEREVAFLSSAYCCQGGVGAFGAALLGDEEPAAVEAAFESSRQGPGGSLVSAKEERDLAALLDLFALGVGDVEEFQERLQAELAALEVFISLSLVAEPLLVLILSHTRAGIVHAPSLT
jgi:hypothetical protein